MPAAPVISQEAQALHDDCLVFDLHCDVLLNQTLIGYNPLKRHKNRVPLSPWLFHCDIPRMQAGGVGAAALGIVVNPLRKKTAAAATFRGLRQIAEWERQAPDAVALVSTADDVLAAREAGRIAVFGGLEGAHGLGGELDPLQEMRDQGLRYVGLSHFSINDASTPAFGWRANPTSPLTNYGRDLVDELNRLNILVDLAHINRAGFLEAAERSTAPVIVSHTGVSGAFKSWRNIDDEQVRAVAETGGVVCIIFAPVFLTGSSLGTLDAVVAHVKHTVSVAGEDAVGIGTDFDGFVVPPRDMPDISFMPMLTEKLLRAGVPERVIRKCLGDNMLRAFRTVCG